MSQIEDVINEIATARFYAKDMLSHIELGNWFRQPAGGVEGFAPWFRILSIRIRGWN